MHINSVAKKLQTSVEKGLSAEEAARRLSKYGPNQLTAEEKREMESIFGAIQIP
jgi:magnesium-transporting ATPase (P-type)